MQENNEHSKITRGTVVRAVGIGLFSVTLLCGVYHEATQRTQENNQATADTTIKPFDPLNPQEKKRDIDSVKKAQPKQKDEQIIDRVKQQRNETMTTSDWRKDLLVFDTLAKENEQKTSEAKEKVINTNKSKQPEGDSDETGLPENRPNQPTPPITPPDDPEDPITPDPPVVVPVDYTRLQQAVTEAQAIDTSLYVSISISQFLQELQVSQNLLQLQNASQQQVDNQIHSLQTAMSQLIKKGDKTELKKWLVNASTLDREIYTPDTWKKLVQAERKAVWTLVNKNVSQSEVDESTKSLKEAMDGLKKLDEPDLTLLYLARLINECEQLVLTEYTPQSTESFEQILAQAKQLITQEGVTEEVARTTLETLQQAKASLVKRADLKSLQELMTKIDQLQENDYTEASWALLTSAYDQAERILADPNTTQTVVDAAVVILNQAKDQLEVRPTEEVPDETKSDMPSVVGKKSSSSLDTNESQTFQTSDELETSEHDETSDSSMSTELTDLIADKEETNPVDDLTAASGQSSVPTED